MPKPLDEDRARRRELLEQKRAARRAAAAKEQQQTSAQETPSSTKFQTKVITTTSSCCYCMLLELPDDAIYVIFSMLPAADLGRLTLSCRTLNLLLPKARTTILVAWLHHPPQQLSSKKQCVGYRNLCSNEAEAQLLLEQAYHGDSTTTGRIVPRGKFAKRGSNEFVSYARFLEEGTCGYGIIKDCRHHQESTCVHHLPGVMQGRFASCSPEHSLCRVGGDGVKSGAGGSGVASWGVGKRGQLGHGKRDDERIPKKLLGGIGYGIRIVQVSAGGGLVRVAHSLLLTDTGQVLSFGTGQYGALGHGFSAAKQLPDVLRPQYVAALKGVCCTCVAAGELHSAVVTCDGDLYTWGDGFCGQLGHGDKRPQVLPKQVVLGGMDEEVVASVTCGGRHTVAVTEDGEVFSFGLGHFGCLGRPFTPFDYDADAAVVAFSGADNQPAPANEAVPDPVALPGPQVMEGIPRNFADELMQHLDLIANLSLDDSSNQCIPVLIQSLQGINIVGACAGHRHTLLLSQEGSVYSCGSGSSGGLGHGDSHSQMYPMKITHFDEDNIRIMQISTGVDTSMAVSTCGDVFAWGKQDGGRIGLGLSRNDVLLPRRVAVSNAKGEPVKAVDVECGYVHSLIVGLDGTLYVCGGVGVEGEDDGQVDDPVEQMKGRPRQVANFNIWHRLPEPKETLLTDRWKKYGKYEVKGRSKMLNELP